MEELPGTAVRHNLGLLVYRMVLSSDLLNDVESGQGKDTA